MTSSWTSYETINFYSCRLKVIYELDLMSFSKSRYRFKFKDNLVINKNIRKKLSNRFAFKINTDWSLLYGL